MSALLEVQGLTAGYRRPVIRDISFALRPGEITAVLGRNGCGKTTLLRSLTGGARILSGTVWAAGEDCLDWSARRRARSIALLSQHSQLLPGLWAEEVIAMGRTPWLGPLSGPGPEDRAMVRAAAERFGVAELLDRDCAQLSEGQRQLVHLARLAVQDAPILLLDDLFDKLDAGRVEQLIRLVSDDAFGQILITDCNPTRLKTILDKAGGDYALFSVADGTVTQERTAAESNTPES